MKVWLEVYLPVRGALAWHGWEELPDGTTAGTLLTRLGLADGAGLTVIVDGRWWPLDRPIAGAQIAVVRQTEGG